MNKPLNIPVAITALGFDPRLQPYPKRMEWQGKTYHFTTRGVRLTIRRGESLWSTVTCSDGQHEFRLRETAGNWTLLSVA